MVKEEGVVNPKGPRSGAELWAKARVVKTQVRGMCLCSCMCLCMCMCLCLPVPVPVPLPVPLHLHLPVPLPLFVHVHAHDTHILCVAGDSDQAVAQGCGHLVQAAVAHLQRVAHTAP